MIPLPIYFLFLFLCIFICIVCILLCAANGVINDDDDINIKSMIYRQYFRYIDPPLVSNTFSGLSLAKKRGPVMFTSVVYIENNGIQIVIFFTDR